MLAKQAADRPQTPESLVGLITPFAQGHNLSALLDSNSPAPALQPTQSIASFDVATDVSVDPVSQSAPPKDSVAQFSPVSQLEPIAELEPTAQGAINHETVSSRKPPNRNLLIAFGMMALMLLVAGIAFVLKTDDGSTIRYEIDDPSILVSFDDQMVTVIDSGKKYEVTPGTRELNVKVGDLEFQTADFKLAKGEHVRMRLTYEAKELRLNRDGLTQTLPPKETTETKQVKEVAAKAVEGTQYALQFNVDSDVNNPHTVTFRTLKDTTESLTVELWTQRNTSRWEGADRPQANMSIANFGANQNIRQWTVRAIMHPLCGQPTWRQVSQTMAVSNLCIVKPSNSCFAGKRWLRLIPNRQWLTRKLG